MLLTCMNRKKIIYGQNNELICEKPREKYVSSGIHSLTDIELLSLMLGSGIRGLPIEELAGRVFDFYNAEDFDPLHHQKMKIRGIGQARQSLLAASCEFWRRRLSHPVSRVSSPSDIFMKIRHFANSRHELFIVISLNGNNEIMKIRTVSQGTVNRTIVHPRDVFRGAVKDLAIGIVAAHNHPSGNLTPSEEDFKVTERLKSAGKLMGIELLDHIIFTESDFFSFLEQGGI